MPLQEPTTSQSPTTVGVERLTRVYQTPKEPCASVGDREARFWAITRTGERRTNISFEARTLINFFQEHAPFLYWMDDTPPKREIQRPA
jgi:hypothetical protein